MELAAEMAEIARENDFFPLRALRLSKSTVAPRSNRRIAAGLSIGEAFVFGSGLSGLGKLHF